MGSARILQPIGIMPSRNAQGMRATVMTGATVTLAAASTVYTIMTGTITCFAGENVIVMFNGTHRLVNAAKVYNAQLRVAVDGTGVLGWPTRKLPTADAGNTRGPAMASGVLTNLTAGAHTITIDAVTGGDHTDTGGQVQTVSGWLLQR